MCCFYFSIANECNSFSSIFIVRCVLISANFISLHSSRVEEIIGKIGHNMHKHMAQQIQTDPIWVKNDMCLARNKI